jgi:hypothetical protein
MAITRRELVELAWLLRMETDSRESMGSLLERIRARAAQLLRMQSECDHCRFRHYEEPTLEDRKQAAALRELPDNVRRI